MKFYVPIKKMLSPSLFLKGLDHIQIPWVQEAVPSSTLNPLPYIPKSLFSK